jgi:hypothetical protein
MEPGCSAFDESRARVYRKVAWVLAFRSKDPFVFSKPWGNGGGRVEQTLTEGSWLIIPLKDGQAGDDVYGCAGDEFLETYRPVGADRPHTYEKHAIVHAYRPGQPFAVRTIVGGRVEVDRSMGNAMDWLVRNTTASREIYRVSDLIFQSTYVLVE